MSIKRLTKRVPSAKFISIAMLLNHQLRFHKISTKDESGKCDIFETGNSKHSVIGVIFDINPAEKARLDDVEGLHYGYEEKSVQLTTLAGKSLEAKTYYATNIDTNRKPYHWYKEHVLIGARANGLPEHYIQEIAAVESIADPKPGRHEDEMAIYL